MCEEYDDDEEELERERESFSHKKRLALACLVFLKQAWRNNGEIFHKKIHTAFKVARMGIIGSSTHTRMRTLQDLRDIHKFS